MKTVRENLQWVHEIIAQYPRQENSLIMVLQAINKHSNYLPVDALKIVAEELGVPASKVYSVATFYKAFSLEPRGRIVIRVCMGTACHIRGAPQIAAEFKRLLNIAPGKTTSDGKYTLETVNCLGACAMAPLVMVGDKYHGNVTIDQVRDLLEGGDAGEI
ncbi:NADH-quinone oxidoreductase subunit NuoE [bacterium]|nr:NADH-quinone oxidoreductase subunit NuoE [candidate division CSSED10-310 bacterium]